MLITVKPCLEELLTKKNKTKQTLQTLNWLVPSDSSHGIVPGFRGSSLLVPVSSCPQGWSVPHIAIDPESLKQLCCCCCCFVSPSPHPLLHFLHLAKLPGRASSAQSSQRSRTFCPSFTQKASPVLFLLFFFFL